MDTVNTAACYANAARAALQAQDATRSDEDRRADLEVCLHVLDMDICIAAVHRVRLVNACDVYAAVRAGLRGGAKNVQGLMQLMIDYGVAPASIFRAACTVAPGDGPGERWSWARLDAIYTACEASQDGLLRYLKDGWSYYRRAGQRNPRCLAALSVMHWLTMKMSRPSAACERKDVLAVMGCLGVSRAFDLLGAMFTCTHSRAPWHDGAASAQLWLGDIAAATRGTRSTDLGPSAHALLHQLMSAVPAVEAARIVVCHCTWFMLLIDDLPGAVAAEAAKLMAPLVAARGRAMCTAADAVLKADAAAGVQSGLFTALCLVCSDYSGELGAVHGPAGCAQVAFYRAWSSVAAAGRLWADEAVLLQIPDRALAIRMIQALADRHSHAWTAPEVAAKAVCAWDRAWAWQRRKNLVLCAAQERGAKRHVKRCHWARTLGFVDQGDLGCELVRRIAAFL